jgi:hypothetical protein
MFGIGDEQKPQDGGRSKQIFDDNPTQAFKEGWYIVNNGGTYKYRVQGVRKKARLDLEDWEVTHENQLEFFHANSGMW